MFIEDVHEGFESYMQGDDTYCIDVVLGKEKLESVYSELVSRLPSIRVTWIVLSEEWESKDVQVFWSNEAYNNLERIMYLLSDKKRVLENGMIKLTTYSDDGATNLNIDFHKTVKVFTKSPDIHESLREGLSSLGLSEIKDLKSIEFGMHHWHYLPYGAPSRTEFEAYLTAKGFSIWRTEHIEKN